ncbi:MAG: hypothetical protein QOC83_2003 [Pseudonocardiales bacterium]|nr:hypothetical protein [Pseudonocardiales bacterium]
MSTPVLALRILALSGDTWGISGPTFLTWYAALAAAVVAAAVAARFLIRNRPTLPDSTVSLDDHGETDPYLAAYLNGGAELTLLAALSALRAAGQLRGRGNRCERLGEPPSGVRPALERAILIETASPRSRAQLARAHTVSTALDELRDELVRRRLLLTDGQRNRIRSWTYAVLAVLAVGLVRLVDGVVGSKPIGYLLLTVLLLTVAGVVLLLTLPVRTIPGSRALSTLRTKHDHLKPSMKPSWTANGPAGAALGVAVFGTSALWTADPGFAAEVVAAKAGYGVAATSGGGGYSVGTSWFGGSGSGCGGSSGGSSWGGGSCGGGGGGGGCGG